MVTQMALCCIVVVCLVQLTLAQVNIDAIVNNAMQSAFGNMEATGPIPAGRPSSVGIFPRPNVGGQASGAFRALCRFSRSNAPLKNVMFAERAARAAVAFRNIADNPAIGGVRRVMADPGILQSFERACRPFCYEMPRCDFSYPYRQTDGQCNNPNNPLLGSAFTPQQRVLPNAYDDMINLPRTRSVDGSPLPSARTVSNRVFQWTMGGMTPVSARFSTFLTHHGQIIDHDVISTPMETVPPNDEISDCCQPGGGIIKPEACFPIPVNVEEPDPYFPPFSTCMNFVRSTGAPPLGCQHGCREQINERSSFIDGSMIYGFDNELEWQLRAKFFGRLAENAEHLMPPHPDGCPMEIQAKRPCFISGDHRPSETPALTVTHVTWLRRHNLIADALRAATGITNDEVLYQETKRIIIAEIQHVTYTEFLPGVLDDSYLTSFNLRSNPNGHAEVYNPNTDPRTINAFGVAAYRMGHSLIRDTVGLMGPGRKVDIPLNEIYEIPDLIYNKGYEGMAHWMSKEPKSAADQFLVDSLRNRLFENFAFRGSAIETPSLDLGALNVQRGRDHGIPSYNAYREFCGLPRAYFFAVVPGGLTNHNPQTALALQRTYRHVDDIDLYAGGISETPSPGSILGPTFQCLIAFQFSLYKHGDRFWYERTFPENPIVAFTPPQLAMIKQTTLSKILCSVMSNIGVVHTFQPQLMLRSDIPGNFPLPCNVILGGNPLGFDITPFAQQLIQLGRRRGRGPIPFVFSPMNPGMRGIMPLPVQYPGIHNFAPPYSPVGYLNFTQTAPPKRVY